MKLKFTYNDGTEMTFRGIDQKECVEQADKFRKRLYMIIAKIDYLLWLITGRYYCHIKIK